MLIILKFIICIIFWRGKHLCKIYIHHNFKEKNAQVNLKVLPQEKKKNYLFFTPVLKTLNYYKNIYFQHFVHS